MQILNLLIGREEPLSVQDGALYAILSILMVFAVLLVIIGITTLIFKLTGLFELKAQIDASKKQNEQANNQKSVQNVIPNAPVEVTDDDMMAALLVATIDYRKEIKKDVKVISIREIK